MIGPIMTPMPHSDMAQPRLLGRVDLEHDGLRQRHQRRPEHALHDPEGHDLLDALGDAAQHGGDGEPGDAGDQQLLDAEAGGKPAHRAPS